LSFCTSPTIGKTYDLSIGQTYLTVAHSKKVPKVHDVKIWNRIVEAFSEIGVKGNPSAIAKEMHMAQPSVRGWQVGDTTPSRANILAIAKKTGYLSSYIEDGELPKRVTDLATATSDPLTTELLGAWKALNPVNRGRLLQFASDLLGKQFPDEETLSELQRRPG
jgi:hypothetical protein